MSNSKLALSDKRYLPEDLIIKILFKMPIKSIVRCTIVCKNWYSLIKSQFFISTHLNNNKDSDCLLVYWHSPHAEERYSLHCDNQDFNDYLPLPLLPNVSCDESWHWNCVAGSCNGLLLMVHSHDSLRVSTFCFMWNPLIRKSLFLPKPITLLGTEKKELLREELFGLGFDSAGDDYKVLRIVQLSDEDTSEVQLVSFQLYSLNAGYWKFVEVYYSEYGVVVGWRNSLIAFVNGFFHYVAFQRVENSNSDSDSSDSDVEYYNFIGAIPIGGVFPRRIWLPKSMEVTAASELSVWAYRDSSIAVFEHNSSTYQCSLWAMKEYGVTDSWTKLLTVTEYPHPLLKVYACAAFTKNGELVLKVAQPGDEDGGTEIVLYDPETQQFREPCPWLNYNGVRFYSYVQTLVLLDVGTNANAENQCNQWSCSVESLGKRHYI